MTYAQLFTGSSYGSFSGPLYGSGPPVAGEAGTWTPGRSRSASRASSSRTVWAAAASAQVWSSAGTLPE